MFMIQSLGVFFWIVPMYFMIQCTKKANPKSASSAKSRKSAVELKVAEPPPPPKPIPPPPVQKSAAPVVVVEEKVPSMKKVEKKSISKKKEASLIKKKSDEKSKVKSVKPVSEKEKLKVKTVEDKMKTAAEETKSPGRGKNQNSVDDPLRTETEQVEQYIPTADEIFMLYSFDKTLRENDTNPVLNRRSRATQAENQPNPTFLDIEKVSYEGNIDQGEIHDEIHVDLYNEMKEEIDKGIKEHVEQVKSKSKKQKSEPSEKAASIRRDSANRLIFREDLCKLHECKNIMSDEEDEDKDKRNDEELT